MAVTAEIKFTKKNTQTLHYKGGIPVADGEVIKGRVNVTNTLTEGFVVKIQWFILGNKNPLELQELPHEFVVKWHDSNGVLIYTEPTTAVDWPYNTYDKYFQVIVKFLENMNPQFNGEFSILGFS